MVSRKNWWLILMNTCFTFDDKLHCNTDVWLFQKVQNKNANSTSELKVRQPMRKLCLLQLANHTKGSFTEETPTCRGQGRGVATKYLHKASLESIIAKIHEGRDWFISFGICMTHTNVQCFSRNLRWLSYIYCVSATMYK